ncbi:MAG: putative metalloprotease CJM1_0395 family protein, partial [Pseudomonadota bacterium]
PAALPAADRAAPRDRNGLTDGERALVSALQARDREVRAHEEAHARVGGQYAGQPSYTFQRGPDGGAYAIGGSVPIDVAPVEGDPRATLAKMRIVKAAALAPAEPSTSDRRIAAIADVEARKALSDLAQLSREARADDGATQRAGAVDGSTDAPTPQADAATGKETAAATTAIVDLLAALTRREPGEALDLTY